MMIRKNSALIIYIMKKIDFLALDGRTLRTFLTVLDESSISKAAERLGVTQSAVSHTLDKLRIAMGDPLFVRSGRQIAATERAMALREPVQKVLDGLKGLTDQHLFDPTIGELDYVIAANDYQRDLIFPDLLQALEKRNIDISTRFIPSGLPAAEMLRQDRCHFLVTPYPPDGPDIYQVRLFEDHLVCFYDGNMRDSPKTLDEFLACDFIDVTFEDNRSISNTFSAFLKGKKKKPKVSVTNFNAVSLFLKNSKMISVGSSLMAKLVYHDMQCADLPFESHPLPMYLVWHQRNHAAPAHRWFRQEIQNFTKQNIKSTEPKPS